MNSVAKPHKLSKVICLLAWGLGLIYVVSRFIPSHADNDFELINPFDNTWAFILHVAYAQHLQFGRNVAFTYGPWGFLARGYYPLTYGDSVVAWLVLTVVYVCAGWRLARCLTGNPAVAWLWLLAFTAAASLPAGNDISDRLTAWALLLLFLYFFEENRAFSILQTCLAFTLAWLGLVKFTGLMVGGILVMVIAADNIVRHRRFPWILPTWLAGVVFFWLLAGQQPGLLWPFLKNSWQLANGYTIAMCQGDLWDLSPVLYLMIGGGFCVVGMGLVRPRRWSEAILFGLGLAGILFLSFKQGFVRNDNAHEITAALTLLMTGLACLAVAAPRKGKLRAMATGLTGAAILFASTEVQYSFPVEKFFHQLAATFKPKNLFSPMTALATNRLQAEYGRELPDMIGAMPLPTVQGPADLYSFCQVALFANGMDYCPRPVVQSYSAYTPALAKLNAEWLRTGPAATNLFFCIQVIDNHFPSLDDGLSWPELLTRYDIKKFSDPSAAYLVMSRSPRPREYHLQPLLETNVVLGKSFDLPAATNGPVWAEIDIQETFAGKLLSFFYKPTVLMADLKLADHSKRTCRMIPGMARAGFVVSPYIFGAKSFLALATDDRKWLAGQSVASLRFFEAPGYGSPPCYRPDIKIRFYRLDFPPQDLNFGASPKVLDGQRKN